MPVRGPGHPLALGREARARLGGAVHALLDVPGLEGAVDAVRLAVVVLASRTPSESGVVEIRTSELGRWLGLSVSYVASVVLPVLRRSGVVSVETVEGEYGQDVGLRCRVLPLWAARDVVGHPLALTKKELATLLRLVEAVMAPGWRHRDGRVTPPGLIGTRTGRGAATDRLALLLLVLEARESGRVRQCGGKVDTGRGRAAATVGRLLGCTASAGERVVERLESRELVLRVRLRTGSGLANRSRLMVPAVAAAHARTVVDDVREDLAEALEPGGYPDVAAGPSEASKPATKPQVSDKPGAGEADIPEPDATATLHTNHPHLATPVVPLQLSGRCSGEAGRGEGRRPERACVREDQTGDGEAPAVEPALSVVEDGPLRGEHPEEPKFPSVPLGRVLARRAPRTARLLAKVVGGVTGYQQGRLERLVNGLLIDGETDSMIVMRLRDRLAKITTGDPGRPYAFRRNGLSWALSIGLPYRPGGMTQVPCRNRWCRNLVLGKATDDVRCDACEIAAQDAVHRRPAVAEAAPPPPLEVLRARFAAPAAADAEDLPPSSGEEVTPAPVDRVDDERPVVPAVVREQIDVIASVDARAGRLAAEAAAALYGPAPDDQPEEYERVPAAMAVLSAITERYADVLAAHYSGTAA
ncbi:hypothetical protein [Streptomyces luteireticuli]|uniref:hypothetical protein n=1 Tax=Streptomyces luteireticuli TaxID=173858 RepID=UPI00355760CE